MPGQARGIQLLKQDEPRHIAYGIYLLSQLLAVDPTLWQVAMDIIGDVFTPYDPVPFGLSPADFSDFAIGQFQKRLERARGASLEEIDRVTMALIERGDGRAAPACKSPFAMP